MLVALLAASADRLALEDWLGKEQAEMMISPRVALAPADGGCHSEKKPRGARRRRTPGIDAGLKAGLSAFQAA